jgi:phosphoribosylformimino-5-aminoimidazole carboxamide ribotide isomerase
MILFPAIDLKGGEAVRLKLGDMAQATVFNTDPAAQARIFETQGFRYLHVVDLDGAFAGESRNREAVERIVEAFPGQIAVGIDARGGKVAVEGWAETSELDVIEMARRFEGAGVAAIIYTDIDRDGVLAGINWDGTLALARAVRIPVIASGGLASMDDIERLSRPDCRILEGAISGRALYDGRIDPTAALALLRGVPA